MGDVASVEFLAALDFLASLVFHLQGTENIKRYQIALKKT